ncbi:MAG: epimerase [Lactobacillales bacterium]|nr:epimerase [Lactobacillales bacterium]
MKVLILGGTGAMGKELVDILSSSNNLIYVTSRKKIKSSKKNIVYLQGDAHHNLFLKEILKDKYDCIVDFMSYTTSEFKEKIDLFLSNTKHYIFLSSSRVYADSKIITEKTDRILDVIDDEEYLKTDEYALAKARQEDILKETGKNNWTIIRPYITYNDNRLQLGFYEKEIWLSRILREKTCVFPKELLNRKTTLTLGNDVSYAISKLLLNDKAFGESIHIANDNSNITWNDILTLYSEVIEEYKKIVPKFHLLDKNKDLDKLVSKSYYQYYYDRCYNRVFDSEKLNKIIGEKINYSNKLKECLIKCLEKENNKYTLNAKFEGILDRISKERTSLSEFNTFKEKIKYLIVRYTPYYYFIKK